MLRNTNRIATTALTIACLSIPVVYTGSHGTYSTKPLREFERDVAANAIEFTQFNNWLNSNYESAQKDRRQALKEHLYSIIDAHVKQLHERKGTTYPTESDLVLTECFVWATRMGTFGSDRILEGLDAARAKTVGSGAAIPTSFTLDVDGDQLVLSSSVGPWRARFPYYFMVGELRDVETTNRLRTQMASISTGFGRNARSDGWSQATIMLVFSPAGTAPGFRDFWLGKFGFTSEDRPAKSVKEMPAYERFDPKTNLHMEVVFPSTQAGAMAVAYIGLDGTYQWNREHFEDFLAILHLGGEK